METLPLGQPGRRVFYLGAPAGPPVTVQLSKNGGPFMLPANRLTTMGNGWFYIDLARDVDTLGPLAWLITGFNLNNQPQDAVGPTFYGVVNQQALNAAFADLSLGFALNEGLGDLLNGPLYLFLISLRANGRMGGPP